MITQSMKFNKRELIFGGIIILGFVVISVIFYAYQILKTANFQVEKKDVYIQIPQGSNFKDVLAILEKDAIVHDPLSFAFMAQLLDYQKNVKPGRYLIKKNMGNLQAVRMLRAGNQEPLKVTFNNIRLKEDFTKKIARYLNFEADTLCQLLSDTSVTKKYGFDTLNIISMFLPNTYELYWSTSPQKFLDRMYKEYNRFWNEKRLKKAKALEMTPQEVSILASIVQAETNKNVEKPRVAGLYINRLQKNIHLEADPTVVFALRDFSLKRLLNRHLEIDSPYNTYKYGGLPPGPINMPSPQSIDAVLNYEHHEYIFMCAKEDFSGFHSFAKTHKEHLKNARLLHAALDAKGIR